MNWDAVGAIAELLGALGVILSLAYLAAHADALRGVTGPQPPDKREELARADRALLQPAWRRSGSEAGGPWRTVLAQELDP